MYNKTEVFEKRIEPLMKHINDICIEEGVDMVAEFITEKSSPTSKSFSFYRSGNGEHHIISTSVLMQMSN